MIASTTNRANWTLNFERDYLPVDYSDYNITDGETFNIYWAYGYTSSGKPNTTDATKYKNGLTAIKLTSMVPVVVKSNAITSAFVSLASIAIFAITLLL